MRRRCIFSDDETEELKKSYNEGMDNTSKSKISLIHEVVKKIKRDDQQIKVCGCTAFN